MYIQLGEEDYKIVAKASDITHSKYKTKDDLVEVDSLISLLEEMIYAYEFLEEKFKDYERYVEENCILRPKSLYEQYE